MTDTTNYDMYDVNPQNRRKIEQTERELQELIEAEKARAGASKEEDSDQETEEDVGVKEDVSEQTKKTEKKTEVETEEADKEEQSYKKRFKDSQRYITKLSQELKELRESAKSAEPTLDNKKDVEEWMSKNPRVASIVQKIAEEQAKKMFEQAETKFADFEDMKLEATIAKTEAKILKAHPDYLELRDDDNFHKWAETLPKNLQESLYERIDDAVGVIHILDYYKLRSPSKKVEDEEEDFNDAAMSVKSRSQKSSPREQKFKYEFTESQIEAMSQSQFEKNIDAIDKARKEGKILFDLSKKA